MILGWSVTECLSCKPSCLEKGRYNHDYENRADPEVKFFESPFEKWSGLMFELENRFAVKLHCRGEQYKTGILLVLNLELESLMAQRLKLTHPHQLLTSNETWRDYLNSN